MGCLFHCPFPSCEYDSKSRGLEARHEATLQHLSRVHAVITASFENLQDLDMREAQGRGSMTDPGSTYVDACTGADILVSLLPLPEAIVDDCRPAGVYHNPSPDCSEIYE
jgi:hypothetical protein